MKRNRVFFVFCSPRFLLAFATIMIASGIAFAHPNDIYWSPLGEGFNHEIRALTVFDGKLIAGGLFTMAGDVQVNHIASWDGANWQPLGAGMNEDVNALVVYDNKLVAGGEFTMANDIRANYVATWDGTTWAPLAINIDSTNPYFEVYSLAVHEGDLIVGGFFLTIGGDSIRDIARWDGTEWHSFGDINIYTEVYAITTYNERLFIGGDFLRLEDEDYVFNIAAWEDSQWVPVGGGLNLDVNSFCQFEGNLIVGGCFNNFAFPSGSGEPLWGVASWNDSAWSPLSSGMGWYGWPGTAMCMQVYEGRLIAAGQLTTAGGFPASGIAAWDGLSWAPLGSGLGNAGIVEALACAVYNNNLVVGGQFTSAGGKQCNNIAEWSKHGCLCGDANDDGFYNINDVTRLLRILYRGSFSTIPLSCGDADGNGSTNILDVVYLLTYLYKSGPAPLCP